MRKRRSALTPPGPSVPGTTSAFSAYRSRQRDGKGRTLARFPAQANIAAHEVQVPPDDAEPQPGAGNPGRIGSPEKSFEEMQSFFRRSRDAPVPEGDVDGRSMVRQIA